jgi:hypothetical protein
MLNASIVKKEVHLQIFCYKTFIAELPSCSYFLEKLSQMKNPKSISLVNYLLNNKSIYNSQFSDLIDLISNDNLLSFTKEFDWEDQLPKIKDENELRFRFMSKILKIKVDRLR